MAIQLVRPDIVVNPLDTSGVGNAPLDAFTTGMVGDVPQMGVNYGGVAGTALTGPSFSEIGVQATSSVGFRGPYSLTVDPSGTQFTQTNIPYSSFGGQQAATPDYILPDTGSGVQTGYYNTPGMDVTAPAAFSNQVPASTFTDYTQANQTYGPVQTAANIGGGEQYGPNIPSNYQAPYGPDASEFSGATGQTYANPYPSGYTAPLDTYGNSPYNPGGSLATASTPTDAFTSPDTGFTPGGGIPDTNPGAIQISPGLSYDPSTGFTYAPGYGFPSTGSIIGGALAGAGAAGESAAASAAGKAFFTWLQDWGKRGLVVAIGIIFLIGALYLLGTRGGRGSVVYLGNQTKRTLKKAAMVAEAI